MTMRTLTARAYAKINLSLQVVGILPDGYHELRTTFQSLTLHDTLAFRASRGPFAIECDEPSCPTDRRNLVWGAAQAVWRAVGRRGAPSGLTVRLAKRIPMQAGLGGGSSDAAAAIRGCARFWRVDLDRREEQAIARTLGADVPYFLEGGTVLGLDRGDTLYQLIDRPPAWVTIVVPSFGVSSKDAFAWFDEGPPKGGRHASPVPVASSGFPPPPKATARLAEARIARVGGSRTNDLEPVVAARHPEIAGIVTALKKRGASQAAMSGSGSAVFGLFGSEGRAEDAAGELKEAGRRVFVARMLGRARYQSASRPF